MLVKTYQIYKTTIQISFDIYWCVFEFELSTSPTSWVPCTSSQVKSQLGFKKQDLKNEVLIYMRASNNSCQWLSKAFILTLQMYQLNPKNTTLRKRLFKTFRLCNFENCPILWLIWMVLYTKVIYFALYAVR